MKLHTWMPKRDGWSIMINQSLSCMKVVLTKQHWPDETGTTSIVNTVSVFVSHMIGTSMVATALRLDFGSAIVTEIVSSRGQ